MWLIQEMPKNNPESSNYIRLRTILKEKNIEHTIVVYKDEKMIVLNNNDYTYDENSELILKEVLSKPFIPNGSVFMNEQLKNNPNNIYVNDQIDFSNITEYIPMGDLLNPPITVGLLKDLYPIDNFFMVRPVKDNKAINGTIMSEGEFYALKKYGNEYNNGKTIMETEFMLSPIQQIDEEYRMFIVDGKISTGSRYIYNGRLDTDSEVPEYILKYVNSFLSKLKNHNIVMDIAKLSDGSLKVIEFNSMCGSGFYESDISKWVEDIERKKEINYGKS